jgi:DNA-binding Lrp family transcriptional regulator
MDELLKLLQGNALETRENLAKQLNLPAAEVAQRIADYEKAGVIRGYQAVFDEDKLDLDTRHRRHRSQSHTPARRWV